MLDEIERCSRFKTIGIAKGLRMEVFAITAQRRGHPSLCLRGNTQAYNEGRNGNYYVLV